ncbi:MAG: nucleotidyltransferase family protein [Acidimicrobiales bacterium]
MSSPLIVEALRTLARPGELTDAQADVAVAPLNGPEADTFIGLVMTHRLHGALAEACRVAGRSVEGRVADRVDDDRLVRLRASAVLDAAAEVLDDYDIPWLAFKGPVVASYLARPELRGFNDLDLLVARDRFGDAIDALVSIGGEELNRNWDPYVTHEVGEVPIEVGTVPIDLHWHVIGLAHTRAGMRFEPDAMLARRRRVMVGGRELPVFDPIDQLLHLCTHAGLSGATRLDQLRDVAALVHGGEIDWAAFVERSRHARVAGLVGHTLDRAAIAAGAPVDPVTLRDLAGSSLRWRRRVDGDGVTELRRSGVHWRRDDRRGAARVIARTVVAMMPALPGRRRGWDFSDPDSVLYHDRPSGGAARRREFLRMVEDRA